MIPLIKLILFIMSIIAFVTIVTNTNDMIIKFLTFQILTATGMSFANKND